MNKIKLNVCSLGDPTDPRNWSGTPLNIIKALESRGAFGQGIQTGKHPDNRLLKSLLFRAGGLYYKQYNDIQRGVFDRYIKSHGLKKALPAHSHTLHMGTLDMPFCRKPAKQKHYLYCDATWHLWSTQSTNMAGYSNRLNKDAERLEKAAYNQFDHIFTISEYVKTDLIEHYKIPAHKITPVGTGRGVIQPFYGEKDYQTIKILFAAKGRFEDKGGPSVLAAFEKAYAANQNLQLTIVGQNNYPQLIDHPGIKTHGFLPIEELQELFNTHSVFLMPAVNEPWGLVYLEALACKMPIIGLNQNAFPEISGYGSYGYILKDITALANLLTELPTKGKELQAKGEAGHEHCLKTYTWENTVDKIIKVIESQTL